MDRFYDDPFKGADALTTINIKGSSGITALEMAEDHQWNKIETNGLLMDLHQDGRIARLAMRRDGIAVYVALDEVKGRKTVEHPEPKRGAWTVRDQVAFGIEKWLADMITISSESSFLPVVFTDHQIKSLAEGVRRGIFG